MESATTIFVSISQFSRADESPRTGVPFLLVFIARERLSELTLGRTVARTVLEVARALLERWHNVLRARTGLIRKCLTLVKSGRAVRRVPHEPPSTLSVSPSLRGHLLVLSRIL